MADKPKPGDRKRCTQCGTEDAAVYQRTSSNAAFGGPGSAFPEEIPDTFAWVCEECGFEEPFL